MWKQQTRAFIQAAAGETVHRHRNQLLYGLLLGGAVSFVIEKQTYSHLPLAFVFPAIYTGYHVFKQRENCMRFIGMEKKG